MLSRFTMRTVQYSLIFFFCALMVDCHSTKEVQQSKETQPSIDLSSIKSPASSTNEISVILDSSHQWSPRYIKTGASSGIMIEFTGLKKDRPLNAHYALIQIWHAEDTSNDSEKAQVLFSPINELHQAFFPLSPGVYVMRQMKTWADRSLYRNVVIKDDHYAIISLDVASPWKQKMRESEP